MRKTTRRSLDELAEIMPTICELKQREFVGGQNRDCLMAQHAQVMSVDGSGNYGYSGGGGSSNQQNFGGSQFWNPHPSWGQAFNMGYDNGFGHGVSGGKDSVFLWLKSVGISIINKDGDDYLNQLNSGLLIGWMNGREYADSTKKASGGGGNGGGLPQAQEGASY